MKILYFKLETDFFVSVQRAMSRILSRQELKMDQHRFGMFEIQLFPFIDIASIESLSEGKFLSAQVLLDILFRSLLKTTGLLSISMVNDWLLCGSMDGLLSLHNLQQGIATVELEQSEKLINVRLGSDLKNLATTSSDGYFSFYKINF